MVIKWELIFFGKNSFGRQVLLLLQYRFATNEQGLALLGYLKKKSARN